MTQMLSIIVPCYNEEDALPLFYDELMRVLSTMSCDHELILVDDGSTDMTLDVMRSISRRDRSTHYISFSRNFGKEAAMYAGFQNVKGDYVVVMDADMQHPPNLLPDMLDIIQRDEYDSVATRRGDRCGENAVRSWFSRMFYKIVNGASDVQIMDSATDFRLMSRRMVDAIVDLSERDRFSKGIFDWVGFRTYWLSFPNTERIAGETKWSFRNLVKYAVSGIVNFSHAPLNIALWIGGATVISSLVATLMLLVGAARHDPVPDWGPATCIIVFVCGLQMICLGVIGQYLANVHTEAKRRPHYIVSESDIDKLANK